MSPLPPAPTKRADTLPAQAYAESAASGKKRSARAASPTPAAPEASAAPKAAAPAAAQPTTASPAKPARRRSAAKSGATGQPVKLFVLDTNVLLHDPTALFRFQEHDIFLPMIVLEELDAHKRGATEVARNARQSSRQLDALVSRCPDLAAGLPLSGGGPGAHPEATGKLWFQTSALQEASAGHILQSLPPGKADNQILGVLAALTAQHPQRPVILVSKDINMRVKARALGLAAEDYENDKTLQDGDLLFTGALALPATFWADQGKKLQSWAEGPHTCYRIEGSLAAGLHINQFLWLETPGEAPLHARVTGHPRTHAPSAVPWRPAAPGPRTSAPVPPRAMRSIQGPGGAGTRFWRNLRIRTDPTPPSTLYTQCPRRSGARTLTRPRVALVLILRLRHAHEPGRQTVGRLRRAPYKPIRIRVEKS